MARPLRRLRWLLSGLGQAGEDAALVDWASLPASLAKLLELLFQQPQFLDAPGDVTDVLVEQGIDVPAVVRRGILEAQQDSHFVERHVQASAVADELEPLLMAGLVDPKVPLGARRFGKQALALVVADGFDGGCGRRGQLADLHVSSDDSQGPV